MAKQITKSAMASKLEAKGARKAVHAHRDDETKFDSGGSLPAGIENGIAQLVDCRFSQYEKGDMKGEYFFLAAGVAVEPETHDGKKVAGKRTQIMEPLCDTPKRASRPTISDHMGWILNEMRKLGADTKGADLEDLETLAASLKEAAPYFSFRTWKGEATKEYPNPRTNEVWNGAINYDGTAPNAVEDNTATDGDGDDGADAEKAAAGDPEEPDFDVLGSTADEGDTESQATLQELADNAGVNAEEYPTWSELATFLAGGATDEGGDDPADAVAPAKDEVWFYKPPRMRKYIEVEITAVFEGKRTANCKNLEDQKTIYKSVSWDDLKDIKP